MTQNPPASEPADAPKEDESRQLTALFDNLAPSRRSWIAINRYFYQQDLHVMRFFIPPGRRILDLGCGTGDLLASLNPSLGVGIDLSPMMIQEAEKTFPHLHFLTGNIESPTTLHPLGPLGPFDHIILSDTVGYLKDCQRTLSLLHPLTHPDTRIVIAYYAWFWEPVLVIGQKTGLMMPAVAMNWMSTEDIMNFLQLERFEPIRQEWRMLLPRRMFGIAELINRTLGTLPVVRRLSLRHYVVARPLPMVPASTLSGIAPPSVTVLIPCRNEKGNIAAAIRRIPQFCPTMEILFVEGGSSDGTWEECLRVVSDDPKRTVRSIQQQGVSGKGAAVREGFAAAAGDIVMILDADLTVEPEELPKFYQALVSGQGEFIYGSRLIYPLEKGAMRFLNYWANRTFSLLFTWLLNQRMTDTLCGTKALFQRHYRQIAANRNYFGDFDPFGDFDLIFGAAKLNLKMVEIPIRYRARTYGETQISRFRHGWLLLRMVWFAFRKLKAF
ncbi:MAG: glycosyltransferase [Magnetococcales bacterium]|nr:glycosyltransferase [Magnetococcales bacterium]